MRRSSKAESDVFKPNLPLDPFAELTIPRNGFRSSSQLSDLFNAFEARLGEMSFLSLVVSALLRCDLDASSLLQFILLLTNIMYQLLQTRILEILPHCSPRRSLCFSLVIIGVAQASGDTAGGTACYSHPAIDYSTWVGGKWCSALREWLEWAERVARSWRKNGGIGVQEWLRPMRAGNLAH